MNAPATALGATTLLIAGMMLVIAGVLTTGLFLPGVVLIGLGLLGCAAAAMLTVLPPRRRA